MNRLLRYEVLVAQVSKQHDVPLSLLYHGAKGLASFRIEARVEAARSSSALADEIAAALSALKDICYKVAMHQRRLADAWGYLPDLPPSQKYPQQQ